MIKKYRAIFLKHWLVIFCLLLGVFTLAPLLQPGFFSMHDDEQIGRLYDLHQALHDGQFPVRITSNLGFGYGYVLFNFYPPFIYYFADVFKEVGFSYLNSTKIMMGVGFLLSWFFMYLFSKKYWGKAGGALAATAYLFAPYHSVDIYVRGAIPEFWSFVFVPAIFWSISKLEENLETKYLLLLSLFGALLMITHNLVALMLVPFILVYFIYLLFYSKKRKEFATNTIVSGILATLMSAFFWIPAIFEKGNTMVNLLTIEKADYRQHFVYVRQFIFSKWGYSGSVSGPWDGLSFSLGFAHIILLFTSILSLLFLIMKRNKLFSLYLLFMLMFLFSLFIQTSHSKFIWDNIKSLSYIQFPWRFLLFSSFFGSFIIGSVVIPIKNVKAVNLFVISAVLIVVFYNKDFFKPEKQFTKAVDSNYINEQFIRWNTSKLAFEYVPAGIKTKITEFGTTGVDINKLGIRKEAYSVIGGEMNVNVLRDVSDKKDFFIKAKTDGILRINTFAFPGWEVYLDGSKINYQDNNDLKLITINVPSGDHLVKVQFTDTSIRRVANLISLFGLVLFGFLEIAILRKKINQLELRKKLWKK